MTTRCYVNVEDLVYYDVEYNFKQNEVRSQSP